MSFCCVTWKESTVGLHDQRRCFLPHCLSPHVSRGSLALLCSPRDTIHLVSTLSHFVIFWENEHLSSQDTWGMSFGQNRGKKINDICKWLLHHFFKIVLGKGLYFKMYFFFLPCIKGCTEERLPYLWSLSAWDSWRTSWPYIALEDRAVTAERRHQVSPPGSTNT